MSMLFAVSLFEEQKHDFFRSMYQKTIILDSVFVISRIIKVLVRVISLSLQLWLITLTSTLIILGITKTSSNNNYYCSVNNSKTSTALLTQVSENVYFFSLSKQSHARWEAKLKGP